jgi:hypothetical protein
MTTTPHRHLRTSIATGLIALAFLGAAFGTAKSASAAAPTAPDHGALVFHHPVSRVDVAGLRNNLEMLGIEDGAPPRPVDHQRLVNGR